MKGNKTMKQNRTMKRGLKRAFVMAWRTFVRELKPIDKTRLAENRVRTIDVLKHTDYKANMQR